jgi:glyceraldehyde 3-phosphate dehydrogenase
MATKVAINGVGRIGRAILKIVMATPELELVAINDVIPAEALSYLLRFDTVYGRAKERIIAENSHIYFGDKRFNVLSEKDPEHLPWGDMGVATVFECTGLFLKKEQCEKHLKAGAGRVLLSAPPKGPGVPIVVPGVNTVPASEKLRSVASCTTNCLTPVAEVMTRRVGVKKAIMSTVHAYTASQALVDKAAKKLTRGRAAAENIVPTTTGAAEATTEVVTVLKDRFTGVAIRVPVAAGSIADTTFLTSRTTSVDEINKIFSEEAESERYQGILGVTDESIVSSDIVGDPHASLVDLTMTKVVDGDLIKIMSWYDNEWGYSNQMVREAIRLSSRSS